MSPCTASETLTDHDRKRSGVVRQVRLSCPVAASESTGPAVSKDVAVSDRGQHRPGPCGSRGRAPCPSPHSSAREASEYEPALPVDRSRVRLTTFRTGPADQWSEAPVHDVHADEPVSRVVECLRHGPDNCKPELFRRCVTRHTHLQESKGPVRAGPLRDNLRGNHVCRTHAHPCRPARRCVSRTSLTGGGPILSRVSGCSSKRFSRRKP
jgi:hypothetical protein